MKLNWGAIALLVAAGLAAWILVRREQGRDRRTETKPHPDGQYTVESNPTDWRLRVDRAQYPWEQLGQML